MTRTRITRTLNRIDNVLKSGDSDCAEIRALANTISELRDKHRALEIEISSHLQTPEPDDDVERSFEYELNARIGYERLNALLNQVNSDSLDPGASSSQHDVVELFREQNMISRLLAESHQKSMLPKREPEPFDGSDVLKFLPFLSAFNNLADLTESPSEKLYYLEYYTRGTPRELVRGCMQMKPPDAGFIKAMSLLSSRYGDEFTIAEAYIKRLDSWPQIRQEDGKALETLSVFLIGVGHYVQNTSSLNHLQSPKEIQSIIMKLPYRLREKWRNHVHVLMEKGQRVEFATLVEFVESQTRLINLPVFGDIKDIRSRQDETPRSRTRTSSPNKPPSRFERSNRHSRNNESKSLATVVGKQNNRSPPKGSNIHSHDSSETRCPCDKTCKELNRCPSFSVLSLNDKRNFVKSKGLCFACLCVGHRASFCRNRSSCSVCSRKHPTTLHDEKFDKNQSLQKSLADSSSSTTNDVPIKTGIEPQAVESKNLFTGAGNPKKIALALIPVKVRSPKNTTCVTTYAALDNFSSDCFISDKLLDELDVPSTPTEIKLTTLQSEHNPIRTRAVSGLIVSDLDENERIPLPIVYSKSELPIGEEDIPSPDEIAKFPQLSEIPFDFIDRDVGLLIGMNVPEALRPLEIKASDAPNGPYASRHLLGWTLNGPLSTDRSPEVSSTVYRTKIENRDDLESQLQPMRNHEFLDNSHEDKERTLEDKRWEKKVSSSTVSNDGHNIVPLPFRDKRIKSCTTKVDNDDPIETLVKSTSSWYRLRRKVAWLLKVKDSLRTKSKLETSLTLEDIQKAELIIFQYVQRVAYSKELSDIPKGHVKSHSSLRKLNPIIDEHGIIRAGGRISNARVSWHVKHPIILPKDSKVAELIIREQHLKSGCLGKNAVLSVLRQKYWIVGASRLIRRITSSCVSCKKLHSRCREQLMADLPSDRLDGDHPPFTNVGVDYFGPFSIVHGRRSEKRYGIIFTCLSSRAVHLEMAESLDSDACINALRRFIARRGQVSTMRSDNGSNFIGAEKQLREEIQKLERHQSSITDSMIQHNVKWIFNPPSASHFGGVWEREIRTIRNVLNGILNTQPIRLSNDSLNTLFCEIESILNNRPLTPLSDDPNDLEALTPNHILLMKCGPTYPPGLFSPSDLYVRRRWRQVQYLSDLFWSRWKKEYLVNLQSRHKWTRPQPSLSVGDLVVLVDHNLPRNRWALGRVVSTYPDASGLVRQVTVKSVHINKSLGKSELIRCKPSISEFTRPINKVVLLMSQNDM